MELSPRRRAYFAYFARLLAGRLLVTNLASFWVGFGNQVGTKMAPSYKNKKNDSQNALKNHEVLDRVCHDFS